MNRYLKVIGSALLMACSWLLTPAFAQEGGPIKVVVGLPAGGSVDAIARLVSEQMATDLERTVLVDNRPGASTRLAVEYVKAAKSDGTTLLATPGAVFYLYPFTFSKLRYEPFKDFVPVSKLVSWELGLAVPANSPFKTLEEYLDAAKRDQSQRFIASPGTGSLLHFAGQLLAKSSGTPLTHVGYKGAADAATALLGNQVPAAVLNLGDLVKYHKAGQVRLLATFSSARNPAIPDVPTIAECGYPNLVAQGWAAMYAPAGTSTEVVARLNASIKKALANPGVRSKLETLGLIPESSSPAALDKLGKDELAKWKPIVEQSGYKEE